MKNGLTIRTLPALLLPVVLVFLPAAGDEAPATSSAPAAEPSVALRAWIDACTAALGSDDEAVRTGAALALGAAGGAARPALERVAKSGSERTKALAERLLAQLDRRDQATAERTDEKAAPAATRPAPAGRSEHRAAQGTQRVLEALKLEGEQRTSVEAVLKEYEEGRRAVLDESHAGKIDRAAAIARIEKLRTDVDVELGKILTPEQKAKYDALVGGAAGGD
jgi:Spy/CpxP family protein refolding chaperone